MTTSISRTNSTLKPLTLPFVALAVISLAAPAALAQDGSAMVAAPAATAPQDAAIHTDRIPAANIEKGYAVPHRAPIRTPDPRLLQSPMASYEQHLNALGYSLANPDDTWEANPILDLPQMQEQFEANAAAPLSSAGLVPVTPPTPGGRAGDGRTKAQWIIIQFPPTAYDSVSKSWTVGNKSALWAQLYFGITHSGRKDLARLQGQASLDGAVLGYTRNLALATADLQAPATGNQSVSLNLSALGYTLWSKNQSAPNSVTVGDGKDWTGRLWQTGFDWSIAGYGVGAQLWLEGTVGAHYGAYCKPLFAQMGADANAAIGLGGRAWANVVIIDASLEAQLTLAATDISTLASTEVKQNKPILRRSVPGDGGSGGKGGMVAYGPGGIGGILLNGYTMTAKRITQVDLHLLKGYARAKVKDPLFGYTLGTWTIWNQPNGLYNWTGVLENYTKATAIPN
jgi:hypothetical protein